MIPELGVVAYQQPQEAGSLITLLLCQDQGEFSPSHMVGGGPMWLLTGRNYWSHQVL